MLRFTNGGIICLADGSTSFSCFSTSQTEADGSECANLEAVCNVDVDAADVGGGTV